MSEKEYCRYVGLSIKQFRRNKAMTLPRLAQEAGISKGNLSKIENKVCNISLETLFKLSEALKVTVQDFLP